MIILKRALVEPAKEAGMKVPHDTEKFDPEEYPHFQVFCNFQIGRPCGSTAAWRNAKAITAIPEDEIRLVLDDDLDYYGVF